MDCQPPSASSCQSSLRSAGALSLDLTSARRRLLAPLAAGLALGGRRALQSVALVAGEAHDVVVVVAVADGAAVDGAAWVAACDRCSRPGRRAKRKSGGEDGGGKAAKKG